MQRDVRKPRTSLPSMNAVGPVKGCSCTGFASSVISMPMILHPARGQRATWHSCDQRSTAVERVLCLGRDSTGCTF